MGGSCDQSVADGSNSQAQSEGLSVVKKASTVEGVRSLMVASQCLMSVKGQVGVGQCNIGQGIYDQSARHFPEPGWSML